MEDFFKSSRYLFTVTLALNISCVYLFYQANKSRKNISKWNENLSPDMDDFNILESCLFNLYPFLIYIMYIISINSATSDYRSEVLSENFIVNDSTILSEKSKILINSLEHKVKLYCSLTCIFNFPISLIGVYLAKEKHKACPIIGSAIQ